MLWVGKGFQNPMAYVCNAKLSSAKANTTSSSPNPGLRSIFAMKTDVGGLHVL